MLTRNFHFFIRKCENCEEEFKPETAENRYCVECDPRLVPNYLQTGDNDES